MTRLEMPFEQDPAPQKSVDQIERAWRMRATWHQAFDDPFEATYLSYRLSQFRALFWLCGGMAAMFYISFISFDWLTYQTYQHFWILFSTLGLGAGSVLPALAASLIPAASAASKYALIRFGLVGNGVGLAIAFAYCTSEQILFPREIFAVHLFYVFFLFGLRFREALFHGLGSTTIFICGQFIAGLNPQGLFEVTYISIGTMIVVATGGYLSERTHRRAWLQSLLLQRMSDHDGLTELVNHRAFFECGDKILRQASRQGVRVALVALDLDHFKQYNDYYGHTAGDECLRAVAKVLSDAARRPLDLAARLGGEEFVLFWYDVSPHWAREQAERVREAILGLQIEHACSPIGKVSASLGLTCVKAERDSRAVWLVNAADQALYQAKSDGRNRLQVTWTLNTKPAGRDHNSPIPEH